MTIDTRMDVRKRVAIENSAGDPDSEEGRRVDDQSKGCFLYTFDERRPLRKDLGVVHVIFRRELEEGEDAFALYNDVVRALPYSCGIFCKEGYSLPTLRGPRRTLWVWIRFRRFFDTLDGIHLGLSVLANPGRGPRTRIYVPNEGQNFKYWSESLRECAANNYGEPPCRIDGKMGLDWLADPDEPNILDQVHLWSSTAGDYWLKLKPGLIESWKEFLERKN